jgi:predicted RNA-binding protein with RPS1 domain
VEAAAAAVRGLTTEPEAGSLYRGARVASVEKFGLILEFLPGRTGLCHVSELGPGPAPDGYDVGDRVDVVLLEAADNRFKLSRRAALALDGVVEDGASSAGSAPAPPPPPPLEVGQVLRGATVRGVTTFGVFVDVGGGRSGLVHVSELAPGPGEDGDSGGRRGRASAAANEAALARYAKGDALDVVITKLGDDGKISLSERGVAAGGDGSVWAESDGFGGGGEDGDGEDGEEDEGPGTPTRASEGARRRR